MLTSTLLRFIFPPPSSLFITVMSVFSFTSTAYLGFSELRGKHAPYSKFWKGSSTKSGTRKQTEVSSRKGMLFSYTPAFLACLTSFVLLAPQDTRFLLLRSALTLHFFKRIFEVLFVHKYSGGMVLDLVILISLSYFTITATIIYSLHLTQGISEPPVDLKYPGVLLFLIRIGGNFYHHYLLSKLRGKSDKEYRVPKGGLFCLIICPHYLFEIIGFLGISCISQTLYAFSFTLGSALYLMGSSYATRRWYLSKLEGFPQHLKALIPYVF